MALPFRSSGGSGFNSDPPQYQQYQQQHGQQATVEKEDGDEQMEDDFVAPEHLDLPAEDPPESVPVDEDDEYANIPENSDWDSSSEPDDDEEQDTGDISDIEDGDEEEPDQRILTDAEEEQLRSEVAQEQEFRDPDEASDEESDEEEGGDGMDLSDSADDREDSDAFKPTGTAAQAGRSGQPIGTRTSQRATMQTPRPGLAARTPETTKPKRKPKPKPEGIYVHGDKDCIEEDCECQCHQVCEGCDCTCHRQRKKRQSKEQKLDSIINFMQSLRIGPQEFVELYVGTPGTGRYKRRAPEIRAALQDDGSINPEHLRRELKRLVGRPFFNEYKPSHSLKARNIMKMDTVISSYAPTWYNLLLQLLPNQLDKQKQRQQRFKDKRNMYRKRIILITSIVAFSIAAVKASWMPHALGIYMVSGGVKRRQMEVLNNFGMVVSYRTIQRTMDKNAEIQRQAACALALLCIWFAAYDNFCRQAVITEQGLGDTTKQQNMTTSYIASSESIPKEGLTQDMLHLEEELDAMDIFKAIRSDGANVKATSLYHIDKAIRRVFGDKTVDGIFQKPAALRDSLEPYKFPVIKQLPTTPPEIYSLDVSKADESKIDGTLQAHDDIFLRFLKLNKDDIYEAVEDPDADQPAPGGGGGDVEMTGTGTGTDTGTDAGTGDSARTAPRDGDDAIRKYILEEIDDGTPLNEATLDQPFSAPDFIRIAHDMEEYEGTIELRGPDQSIVILDQPAGTGQPATGGGGTTASTGQGGGDGDAAAAVPGVTVRQQLKTPSAFKNVLRIVAGDQLTIQRMRTVMGLRVESQDPYESRAWMVPSPAWFHILMNAVFTVLRTHWHKNKDGEHLEHSLYDDIKYWTIHGASQQKPKFYIFMQVVTQSFQSRINAVFTDLMVQAGWLNYDNAPGDETRLDTGKKAISRLSPTQYINLVEKVYDLVLSDTAYRGESEGGDPSFTTMSRMLREIEQVLTIQKAIRMQDVGHLRRLVPHLIVSFFGAGQYNYGHDMLWLQALLTDGIADPVLQDAVLGTAVLNMSDQRGKGVAADEQVELFNGDYSVDIKNNKNSTHDLDKTFQRKALNRESNRVHRIMFESNIGVQGTSYHTYKKNTESIHSRADWIRNEGMATYRPRVTEVIDATAEDGTVTEAEAETKKGLSTDILVAGAAMLFDKVKHFNSVNKKLASGTINVSVPTEDPGVDDPIDNADAHRRGELGGGHGDITDIDIVENPMYAAAVGDELGLDEE